MVASIMHGKAVRVAGRVYRDWVTVGLGLVYAGAALAQAFDASTGPFTPVCVVVKWFAVLVVPVASIAFLMAAATFIWGEELTGMSKKTVNIIVGVCIAFGGGAIVSWLASRFGFTSACSSVF